MMFLFGTWWLGHHARQAAAAGEGYGAHPLDAQDASPATHDPSLLVAFLPLLMVLVMNVAMTWWIIPAMDLA